MHTFSKLLFVTIILFCSIQMEAKVSATFYLHSGEKVTGLSNLPDLFSLSFKIKDEETKKKIFLSSDEIKKIEYYFETDTETDTLTYINIAINNKRNTKLKNKKAWLSIVEEGYLTLLTGIQDNYQGPAAEMWFCLEEGENYAYFIKENPASNGIAIGIGGGGFGVTGPAFAIGVNSKFRMNIVKFIKDHEELYASIPQRKHKELVEVIQLYNAWKAQ